jgi:hypothetical protein
MDFLSRVPCCLLLLSILLSDHVVAKILVVGATGTTGIRAIQGLLDTGYYRPEDLILLTRNANQRRLLQLKERGFGILQADLEQETEFEHAVRKLYDTSDSSRLWQGCYIHSTSSDTPDLDTLEVTRARNLCSVLKGIATRNQKEREDNDGSTVPFTVVYNSAAARPNHGVGRIAQKWEVEQVFREAVGELCGNRHAKPSLIFVSLRANIFMEELWKKYTRPSILQGEYPLPLNRFTPVYLTSVRDMGRLAGLWIQRHGHLDVRHGKLVSSQVQDSFQIQNVASEKLRAPQIARLFGDAQGTPCRHVNTYRRLKPMKAQFPELWEQIQYVRSNHKERTDMNGLKRQVKAVAGHVWELSSFAQFLNETDWANRDLTFADLRRPDSLHY